MKVTTEELERCEVLMTVEIEPAQEQDLLKKAAKRIARQIRIPGFRPGKAPYSVVVRRFGLEAVQQEALEQSVDKVVRDALSEAEIEPFAQIQLEGVDWDPLTIKIKIPTEPDVKLGDYRDIRLESDAIEVSDEDITEALENMREQNAMWVPVERAAKLGDLITMSVVEKDGEEVLVERDSVEHELVLPDEVEDAVDDDDPAVEIDEAEDADRDVELDEAGEDVELDEIDEDDQEDDLAEAQAQPRIDLTTPILGLSAGDEKTFSIDYPEGFGDERYAGKEITFEVKVSSVKEKELDPLDDDFAKSVSDFETLDELKADIEKNIKEQRDRQQKQELGEKALTKMIEESAMEWPLAFEEESIQQEIQGFERRIQNYGFTVDSYLSMENKTKEAFQEEIRERVIESLKRNLVLSEIAELENLDVSESEILQRAKMISDLSGQGDQLWRAILGSQAQQGMIAHELLSEKVIQWLGAVARGEEPPANNIETDSNETESKEADSAEAADNGAVEAEVEPVESDQIVETDQKAEAQDVDDESTEEPAPAEIKS